MNNTPKDVQSIISMWAIQMFHNRCQIFVQYNKTVTRLCISKYPKLSIDNFEHSLMQRAYIIKRMRPVLALLHMFTHSRFLLWSIWMFFFFNLCLCFCHSFFVSNLTIHSRLAPTVPVPSFLKSIQCNLSINFNT